MLEFHAVEEPDCEELKKGEGGMVSSMSSEN
jgi:hypothetical protein